MLTYFDIFLVFYEDIENQKNKVNSCYSRFKGEFNKKTQSYINSLINVSPGGPGTYDFEKYFEIGIPSEEEIEVNKEEIKKI